jgi:hypothetical protein
MEVWIGTHNSVFCSENYGGLDRDSILFSTTDWIICHYPNLHIFRYKRLNYLSLSKPLCFSLQKTELFVSIQNAILFATKDWIICPYPNPHTFRYKRLSYLSLSKTPYFRCKRLNYLSLSKPPYFSLQKTELFVSIQSSIVVKSMEVWIGTNNSVFCSEKNGGLDRDK